MRDDDRNGETRARRRFMMLNAVRLGGLVLVFIGLAIWFGRIAFPRLAGLFLVVMGFIEFFFIPMLLKAGWRSREERTDGK